MLGTVTCSSGALRVILNAVKNIMKIIQIIGPILLVLAIILHVTKLMANPDDKKIPKKILNSTLAAILLFFIPMFVNVVMNAMGQDYNISACWNSASTNSNDSTYQEPYEQGKKKSVIIDSEDYEKGQKQKLDVEAGSKRYQTGSIVYYVFLPENATTNMPLLMWLHGDGASESMASSHVLPNNIYKAGHAAIIIKP